MRPAAIIERLDLRRPIFRRTAAYGHFGRTDGDGFTWENVDAVRRRAPPGGRRIAHAATRPRVCRVVPDVTAVERVFDYLVPDELSAARARRHDRARPVAGPARARLGRRRSMSRPRSTSACCAIAGGRLRRPARRRRRAERLDRWPLVRPTRRRPPLRITAQQRPPAATTPNRRGTRRRQRRRTRRFEVSAVGAAGAAVARSAGPGRVAARAGRFDDRLRRRRLARRGRSRARSRDAVTRVALLALRRVRRGAHRRVATRGRGGVRRGRGAESPRSHRSRTSPPRSSSTTPTKRCRKSASPTWHARDVLLERARRAGAQWTVVSPAPTVEAEAVVAFAPDAPPPDVEVAGWPRVARGRPARGTAGARAADRAARRRPARRNRARGVRAQPARPLPAARVRRVPRAPALGPQRGTAADLCRRAAKHGCASCARA